jgi:hypothetical protein
MIAVALCARSRALKPRPGKLNQGGSQILRRTIKELCVGGLWLLGSYKSLLTQWNHHRTLRKSVQTIGKVGS